MGEEALTEALGIISTPGTISSAGPDCFPKDLVTCITVIPCLGVQHSGKVVQPSIGRSLQKDFLVND